MNTLKENLELPISTGKFTAHRFLPTHSGQTLIAAVGALVSSFERKTVLVVTEETEVTLISRYIDLGFHRETVASQLKEGALTIICASEFNSAELGPSDNVIALASKIKEVPGCSVAYLDIHLGSMSLERVKILLTKNLDCEIQLYYREGMSVLPYSDMRVAYSDVVRSHVATTKQLIAQIERLRSRPQDFNHFKGSRAMDHGSELDFITHVELNDK